MCTIIPSLFHEIASLTHVDKNGFRLSGPFLQAFDNGFCESKVPRRSYVYYDVMLFRKGFDLVMLGETAVHDARDLCGGREILIDGSIAEIHRNREIGVVVAKCKNQMRANKAGNANEQD